MRKIAGFYFLGFSALLFCSALLYAASPEKNKKVDRATGAAEKQSFEIWRFDEEPA